MYSTEELHERIAKKLDGFCRKNGDGNIYQPINYMVQLGGKRIRPLLSLMAANLFSDDIEDAIYPAIAIEIFHNFTLMHDDIMDEAPLRRGQATVHEKWNRDTAILSGDAMMIQSYQLLIKTKPGVLGTIIPIFNTTALEVCEGQQLDMDFQQRQEVSMQEYLRMIRQKTSVLLGGAMKIGAAVGGADEADQQAVYDLGESIGLSFQLMDDYLDAFGDPAKTGKQQGGDILAEKKTYLHIRAMEKASAEEKSILANVKSHSPMEKVKATIDIYRSLGVEKDLDILAKDYYAKAITILEQLDISSERKQPLREMLGRIMDRNS